MKYIFLTTLILMAAVALGDDLIIQLAAKSKPTWGGAVDPNLKQMLLQNCRTLGGILDEESLIKAHTALFSTHKITDILVGNCKVSTNCK